MNAWILRTTEYKESSKLVVAMHEQGVFSFVAKGMRNYKSPWRSLIEPFRHVELKLSRGTLPALQEAQLLSPVDERAGSLEVISYIEHLAELFYTLRDTIAFDTLYPYWIQTLPHMIDDPEGYGMMMEIKLLYVMGITPVFDRCVHCESKDRVGFSIADGGMVCKQHLTPESITDHELLLGVYQLYQQDLSKPLPILDRPRTRRFIDQYFEYHVNVQTIARQMIRSIYHY
jgi:DNA repair protein RecO (recombination protein O)